ncbi:MAG: PepSY-associated TM helix domain-containing protein [Bacteroidota bacterium]
MKLLSNKTLFKIHGWLGLNIGLLLFVICFSGTFATLSNEIDWLLNPALRVEAKDEPIAWEAMYQNLKKEFPDATSWSLAEQKNSFTEVGDYFAAAAFTRLPGMGTVKIHLNPYSGEITGYNPFLDVQRFFRTYHNNFFDGIRGVIVVTVFAFFLLFSVLSGFLFYKNWFKNLFKLRLAKGLRVLIADSHRLAGIWSLLFALLIAVTGVWYLTELTIARTLKSKVLRFEQPENIPAEALAQFGDSPELISLDIAVQNAEQAFPDYRVEDISLPRNPNSYIVMHGQDKNPLTRDRTNQVHVHPYTGEVVHIQKATDLTTLQFINNIADPLHFGTFGGLAVKILWFIFGLILSFSILAGTYIWYLRHLKKLESKINRLVARKQRSSEKPKVNATLKQAGFSLKHLGVGRGVVISTSLILFYLGSTGVATVTDGFRIWSGYPEGYHATVDKMQLGPWAVELECTYPCTLEEGSAFQARFRTEGIPNYDSLYLDFYTASGDTLGLPFKGGAAMANLKINEEIATAEVASIQLTVRNYREQTWSEPVEVDQLHTIAETMAQRFTVPPKKMYPDVPARVYVVAAVFSLLTMSIIMTWTLFILRAVRKEQRLLTLEMG